MDKNKKIKKQKISKKPITKDILVNVIRDQVISARDRLDIETLKALRDLKTKTIEKIYQIQKTPMRDEDRYRKVSEFVQNEIKNDELLSNKIEDEALNGRRTTSEIASVVRERAREIVGKVTVQGWLEYYWNWDLKAYKLIPLSHVNTVFVSEDTNEIFLLDEPTKLFKGKPVFMVIRGIPFAIPMDFRILDLFDNLNKMKEIDRRFVFGRAHLSTWDLYGKFKSLIVDRIFKPNRFTFKSILGYVISFIFGCLVTWSIISPYLMAEGG